MDSGKLIKCTGKIWWQSLCIIPALLSPFGNSKRRWKGENMLFTEWYILDEGNLYGTWGMDHLYNNLF